MRGVIPLTTLIFGCFVLASTATVRAEPPASRPTYAGVYTSDQMTVSLAADGPGYGGVIHFNGNTYPFHATADSNGLSGTFAANGGTFSFTASLQQETLTLHTGTSVYQLTARHQAEASALVDYTLHDDTPGINCDVVRMKIPQGWGVCGHAQWNPSAIMPGRYFICATDPNGADMLVQYPSQCFVWRDNFNLLGLNFELHEGDADPALGEEIQQPLASASDCIKRVIVPRFRKDLASATVISGGEMSQQESLRLAQKVMPDIINSPQARQLNITPRASTVRVEYTLGNRPVQEEIQLLEVTMDFPSNNGAVHVWTIPYCTSIRAEKGKLDAEKAGVFKSIESSAKPVADWNTKRDEVIKQTTQQLSDKLRALAAAIESQVIAQMNRNIFNTCQQSYHRRMEMQQQTFHDIDLTIAGRQDYTTAGGQSLEAPITPMGQQAWRSSTGEVRFFNNGVDPNNGSREHYEQMTAK